MKIKLLKSQAFYFCKGIAGPWQQQIAKIITIPITEIISVEQGGKTVETLILQTHH